MPASTVLPLDPPRISRGFATVDSSSRSTGTHVALAIADALTTTLGLSISLGASAAPAPPERVAGAARIAIPLASLGYTARIEIETRLLAHVLDQLANRGTRASPSLTATRSEAALLAFCALVAVDAARGAGLDSWSPLVAPDEPPPGPGPGDLGIVLAIQIGHVRGWGRVLVPSAALVTLAGRPEMSGAASRLCLHASLRDASITLAPDELAATEPGDVLLLDATRTGIDLVLPGGLTFRGRLAGAVLHIEEIRMTEAQASYPIVLSVEIARVRLTLAELARLAPGVAIPLDVRKDGAIVLRAGEDVIARGTLVDVEGSLGVRVAQIGGLP